MLRTKTDGKRSSPCPLQGSFKTRHGIVIVCRVLWCKISPPVAFLHLQCSCWGLSRSRRLVKPRVRLRCLARFITPDGRLSSILFPGSWLSGILFPGTRLGRGVFPLLLEHECGKETGCLLQAGVAARKAWQEVFQRLVGVSLGEVRRWEVQGQWLLAQGLSRLYVSQ